MSWRIRLYGTFVVQFSRIRNEASFVMIIEKEQTRRYGGVAQLGEHLPCKQGVMGSNPIISTTRQCRDPKREKMVRTKCQVSERIGL